MIPGFLLLSAIGEVAFGRLRKMLGSAYYGAMQRDAAIARLKGCADVLKARGATSLYIFGSVARDQAGPRSDLDLFVDYDPSGRFSLLDLAALKNMLEDELAVEVDVTTRDSLHPLLRESIERSAIRVF